MKLKIKQIRQQKGMSLRELSQTSGVALGYLSELENEKNVKKNPTIEIVCKLAKALDCEPQDLYEC